MLVIRFDGGKRKQNQRLKGEIEKPLKRGLMLIKKGLALISVEDLTKMRACLAVRRRTPLGEAPPSEVEEEEKRRGL